MFLLRCARPFLRHWAERASLPLKSPCDGDHQRTHHSPHYRRSKGNPTSIKMCAVRRPMVSFVLPPPTPGNGLKRRWILPHSICHYTHTLLRTHVCEHCGGPAVPHKGGSHHVGWDGTTGLGVLVRVHHAVHPRRRSEVLGGDFPEHHRRQVVEAGPFLDDLGQKHEVGHPSSLPQHQLAVPPRERHMIKLTPILHRGMHCNLIWAGCAE